MLDLAVSGDAAALEQLFAPCIPRLRRVASRLLYNHQDSEDALQDGLLSAFRHLNQFRGGAQFTTWMHSIVVNAAKSKLRQQWAQPLMASLDQPLFEQEHFCIADKVADSHSNVDEEYDLKKKKRILEEAIQGLSPALRIIVRLYDIEGLRMREVAARLGLSMSAAKTRHFRAYHQILKMVRDACTQQQTDAEGPAFKPAGGLPRRSEINRRSSGNLKRSSRKGGLYELAI